MNKRKKLAYGIPFNANRKIDAEKAYDVLHTEYRATTGGFRNQRIRQIIFKTNSNWWCVHTIFFAIGRLQFACNGTHARARGKK